MHQDITGVVLAGGKSLRMGCNKALLPLGGQSVIERVSRMMQSLFVEVIVMADDPEPYRFLGVPVHPDIHPQRGPLGGIHAALTHAGGAGIFVVSCDMPLVTPAMVEHILAAKGARPICVPVADGFVQHLCGWYDKSVTALAAGILREKGVESRHEEQSRRGCPLSRLLVEAGGGSIDVQDLLREGDLLMFANMNRPEEYRQILAHYSQAVAPMRK